MMIHGKQGLGRRQSRLLPRRGVFPLGDWIGPKDLQELALHTVNDQLQQQ